jgi:hypothetical protein
MLNRLGGLNAFVELIHTPDASKRLKMHDCLLNVVTPALQYYDKCIQAIQEDPASTSSTWDC